MMKKFLKRRIRDMYEYVENPEKGILAIRILHSRYKGVIYSYKNIRFGEVPNADGNLPLTISYSLHFVPKTKSKNVGDSGFIKLIGDIAINILEEKVEKEGSVFSHDEEEIDEPIEINN